MEIVAITLGFCAAILVVLMIVSRLGWHYRAERDPLRHYFAVAPHASVDLGVCTFGEALERASKLGSVSYYDGTHGIFFFDTHEGGELPKDAPK